MKSLFEEASRDEVLGRLGTLHSGSARRWGKMNAAQMVRHCTLVLETGSGDRPTKQRLLGKILVPFIRSSALGTTPFSRNSPTNPDFIVADERDLDADRARLVALIRHFAERGASSAATQTHPFFGRLSGEEWGELMYKHLDHHLGQFGA